MYGYKIRFNSLPVVVWACETTVKDYMWKNRNPKSRIEIAVSTYESKTRIINGNAYTGTGNDISCIAGSEKITCFCEPGASISITTVAVEFSDLECTGCEFTDQDYTDESVILLPAFVENPPLDLNIYTVKALHKMIKFNSSTSESSKKAFLAEFFNLIYEIDRATRNFNYEVKTNYYIKKINYFIDKYYSQKITLKQIAKELNLSSVYVSSMYKHYTGITFSEQLLNVRMANAEKMLIKQNLPTSKVATLCGFCDESHFRKTFKKFFNLNIKDYRNIKNGITLYHDKPLRTNDE